jgi:RNA polymerase-interacting CarD/CdnL/TRCF family regulator
MEEKGSSDMGCIYFGIKLYGKHLHVKVPCHKNAGVVDLMIRETEEDTHD